MSRKSARTAVFKLVFEYGTNKEFNETSLENFLQEAENDDDKMYISTTYTGITKQYEQLKEEISSFAKGFSADRIYPVDLAILIVAVYEIKNIAQIPYSVSVNEALNISSAYATEKSTKFINGILKNFKKEQ